MQDGARQLAVVVEGAVAAHQLVIAHQHHMLVDGGDHAVPRLLLDGFDALLVDFTGVGAPHGYGDGMVGEGLGMCGEAEQLVLVDTPLGMDGHHVERAVGQGSRLVEHDRVNLRERF